MKYQIAITGMHCTGCSNLIKMTLEDEELANVSVDVNTNSATFESSLNEVSKVKVILDKVFSDLPGYSYTNIQTV
jgi:copper chaperone CopZ